MPPLDQAAEVERVRAALARAGALASAEAALDLLRAVQAAGVRDAQVGAAVEAWLASHPP